MGPIAVLLHPDSELEVRQRIFQLFCLIAGFFATVVIAPFDVLEHLPWLLSGGVFLFGVAFLAMFWLANHREIYTYRFSSSCDFLLWLAEPETLRGTSDPE